ncbi:conserved hypothetical protein [Methylocella tundrae]|uniref:PNPLA domain-containing protein n=1 Tax=Methylocella tundrae TaxID=227605 RepID=A0A8B6M821_METTU|nr:CBASS cGAMP-activated phospholipase [Methylocella tundrae]VTZ27023.1 conserved hypothetical protein [Methylocella tundrae]VTZ51169.1 conserved hypothetical protein [Methylocella tundrae]
MFRILCLDGGGIKGVFTAAVLARIEELAKKSVVDHFDLICGTSTGGILAVGLGLGLSPRDLLEFYRDRGASIFPGTSLVERNWGLFRQIFLGPKFSHDVLRSHVAAILKERKFGESKCRLAIPSYDAVSGRIYIFKTAHEPRFVNDINVPAVDVALATSAAPTYFAAASAGHYGKFVDGGVWANCPAMVGLVEAVSFLNIPLDDINILSIGTTTEPFSIANNTKASALKWNLGLVNLMFEAQAESTMAQVRLLLRSRMHRINFQATAGRFSLDNASRQAIDDLTNIGINEAQKKIHTDVVLTQFVNGVAAAPFTPCA